MEIETQTKTKNKSPVLSLWMEARREFEEGKKLIDSKNGLAQKIKVAELAALKEFGTSKHEELLEEANELKRQTKYADNEIVLCGLKIKELGDYAYGLVIDAGYNGKSAQRICNKFYSISKKLFAFTNKSISLE